MTGYRSLSFRLRKLEVATGRGGNQKIYPGRIIARDEADKDRQIAELLAAGAITPDTLVICRMIVPAGGPMLTGLAN